MRLLSVCMPSNRDFAKSKRAIETALQYCEARNALLIVSDNSRDPQKASYWQGRSELLIYFPDGPSGAGENGLAVIRAVETPFFLSIGDDDELLFDPTVEPVDLAKLGDDYIGVKPLTEMFLPDKGVLKRKEFGIEAEEPGERLKEYYQKSSGDNTAFYSIFRIAPFRSLLEFFMTYHPTKGNFCDWQLVFTLFLSGKVASDPSTIYRYNASAWASDDIIQESAARSFVNAGLTADYQKYEMFLWGLDLYVFVSRRGAGFPVSDVNKLLNGEVSDLIDYGLDILMQRVGGSQPEAVAAARKARAEKNPALKYLSGCAVLDHFVPGLKDKYIAFLKVAISQR